MRRTLGTMVVLALIALVAVVVVIDRKGEPESAGTVTQAQRDGVLYDQLNQRKAAQALGVTAPKQILFGDVHAHTTFSMDAFAWSIPLLGGSGLHPPADACDYARFVANLDFWALTDHAESLTPRHWQMITDTVRACNAAAGDPTNPDMVTFVGWEWTQMGNTRETHYGHRNVFLLHDDPARTPTRPIASDSVAFRAMRNDPLNPFEKYVGPYLAHFSARQRQFDQQHKQAELRNVPICEADVPVRELPANCIELAATPAELFDKLRDWGYPAMAVPHGTTWGFYTPPGADWDKQVTPQQADAQHQRLIEIFSGHGNAEPYRSWRAMRRDADGAPVCPPPTPDYLPGCHRAGELIRARCTDPDSADCGQRVREAQQAYLSAGRAGHLVVPGAEVTDWLDAGQCRDCYLPPLNHRPGGSVQYILAKRNFEETDADGTPFGLRFGFIGSSDDHNARPGTGFKERNRSHVTDAYGAQNRFAQRFFADAAKRDGDEARAQPFELGASPYNFLQVNESERQASFFYTGGLMAVHSQGRDRRAIWEAIERREVYATSGERMLLWFDLLDAGGRIPMGSIVERGQAPTFEVRALGAFEQRDGCPQSAIDALGADRLQKLSGGECYHPSDQRKPVERIEVVRIRPQIAADEAIQTLIDDPWKVLPCPGDGSGCTVQFSDPDFEAEGRETIYYVRALQAPTATINAGGLRCRYGPDGACEAVDPCYGDTRTPAEDDCTAPARERAWSSPIYLQPSR
ncbi:MAG: DUF3604 domain-containing protein [Algiphilus sp.]